MLTQTLCRIRAVRTSFRFMRDHAEALEVNSLGLFLANSGGSTLASMKLRQLHETYHFCSYSTSWTDTRVRKQFVLLCPAKEKQTKTSFRNRLCFWHFLAILWSFTVRSLNIFSRPCCCLKDTHRKGSLTGKQVVSSLVQSHLCRPVPGESCCRWEGCLPA